MKKRLSVWFVASLLVGGLVACGGGGGDGETDVKADVTDALVPDSLDDTALDLQSDGVADVVPDGEDGMLPDVGEDTDTVDPLAPFAFTIQDPSELVPGHDAVGRIGDFRIGNSHIDAVIGGADHSIWGPYGGGVLDFTVAGGEDYFEEQFPIAGFLRGVRVNTIEVVKDGSDGEALIRITGTDGPIPLVAAMVPLPPVGADVTVEYALSSDSDCLEIRTSITNTTGKQALIEVGDGLVFSERGRTFGSGAGFNASMLVGQGSVDYLGTDLSSVSYMMAPDPGGAMAVVLSQEELNAVLYDSLDLAPGETGTVKRCLYASSGRSIRVLNNLWKNRGVELTEVTGSVDVATEGYDFSEVSVEMRTDDGFQGAAMPNAAGELSFLLPSGTYTGTVTGPGVGPVETPLEVVSGTPATLEFDPEDPGRIDVSIVDPDGAPVPSRIMAQLGAEDNFNGGRVALIPDLQGKATIFLPAGEYTVQGTHGFEWSYCRKTVQLAAGESVTAECPIEQIMDYSGWIQGDLHTHSEHSIDSQMLREVRVTADIAEGLDFWASTEHDVFTDFAPTVEAMGVGDLIMSSRGNEVSPVGRHFNGLGCSPTPEQMYRYFEVPWVNFTEAGEVGGFLPCPAVWKSMHEDFNCRVVQINHPREGQGYFDFVHYDPIVGPSSAKPGELDMTFDAIEVWNSSDNWPHLRDLTLVDWYSFLNRGYRKVATGNADTHDLSQWAGQPRNLVKVDGELSESAFYDALLASKSQVSSAPFIEFTINDEGLGSTITPATPTTVVRARIRVSAPTWAPLTTVQLIGNGEIVQEWDITDETDLERLDVTVELSPAVDTWYHVRTFDPVRNLTPVYPGRSSAAFTNPIWIDLAGDGFDPPIVD